MRTTVLSGCLAGFSVWVLSLCSAPGSTVANSHGPSPSHTCEDPIVNITENDKVTLQGALNLEYLEADFFLWSACGYGLDVLAPGLPEEGSAPLGAQKANLDPYINDIFQQFGLQEIGHVRKIKETIGEKYSFPRPLINLDKSNFAMTMDMAIGRKLQPPFDPYANSINYLLSAYIFPYLGMTTYNRGNSLLVGSAAKLITAQLLSIEAAQDAVIRNELYRRRNEQVVPYGITVAEFTAAISTLRNNLSGGFADEGVVVPKALGADGLTTGNIIAGDEYSIAFYRSDSQFFATLYLTGNSSIPGGFYPQGAKEINAEGYLSEGRH